MRNEEFFWRSERLRGGDVNRQGVAIMIFLPIVYTFLFGGLFYENSLTRVPIIVCNLDDDSAAQTLVNDFINTPEVNVVGVVVIPKDFSQKLARGENVAVELAVNYSSTVTGGTIVRAVQSVVATKNAEVLVNRRIAAARSETFPVHDI